MSTPLTISDLLIIRQALEEYEESEYAGEADINRARIALGRIRGHVNDMENHSMKVAELRCPDEV